MQVVNNVSGLPTADVTQLVTDASSAPSGTGVFLSSADVTALLSEIYHIAQEAHTATPYWTFDNENWSPQQFQYPTVRNIYVALGGTDPWTASGTS